jgi:transcriptional regulator with XRE-family HTH domain
MEKEKFKRLRRRLKRTQAQIALELGVTVTTVARWEQGVRNIRPEMVEKIRQLEREAKGQRDF